MGERMLRGSRLGAVSYESDRNTELAPRQTREYRCARGHQFEVPFAVATENFGRTIREGVPYPAPLEFSKGTQRMIDLVLEAERRG